MIETQQLCVICGGSSLLDFAGRQRAYCPRCQSLERHRALARAFSGLLDAGEGRSAMEVGPVSPIVFGDFLRDRGWSYFGVDRSAQGNDHDPRDVRFIDAELDLRDLVGVGDGQFDLVVVQHVIEEIPDYKLALDEIARVIPESGVALLEIPYDPGREGSMQHAPDHFGNVWRFGQDLESALHDRFAAVEPVTLEEGDYRGVVFRCGSPLTAPGPSGASESPGTGEALTYAQRVARAWGAPQGAEIRSFWQSPVVMAEINRRITGKEDQDPVAFFCETFCSEPLGSALSLGCGGGQLELRFMQLNACEEMLGVDLAEERIAAARSRTPAELSERLRFEVRDLEVWQPSGPLDLIVAQDLLHHIADLDRWCALIVDLLSDTGLLYVHDFIGPARFQWTDEQISVINRLLERLPDHLRRDVLYADGRLREPLQRPDPEGLIAADPSEAVNPRAIQPLLNAHLEPVLEKPYGGAVFHQFFNRLMGNFADEPDLVRIVMELDFILTDVGALQPDYLWGVYRKRALPAPTPARGGADA